MRTPVEVTRTTETAGTTSGRPDTTIAGRLVTIGAILATNVTAAGERML
jgi:hypothetical protein